MDEGHFCDLKSIDIRPARMTVTASAFANADGGELFIGIDEDTRTGNRLWRGFSNQEAANAHVQVLDSLFPLGSDFQYSFLTCDTENGLVLKADIRKTQSIRRSSDGAVYVRRGAQNLPVNTPEALRQLEYVKGLATFWRKIRIFAPESS
jgi:ATP-dependent DNA helicase RecG